MKAVKPRSMEKIYREAMMGGGHINTDMQQFMENDRKAPPLVGFSAAAEALHPPFSPSPLAPLVLSCIDADQIDQRLI